jgi:hypothetical protein
MDKATRMPPRVCERFATSSVARGKQREIATRAYRLWLARGFHNGSPQEDWLRALREVSQQQLRA